MSSIAPLPRVFEPSTGSDRAVDDFRPILLRNERNVWTRAEEARDELYDLFTANVRKEGVGVLVLKSAPSVFPAWVQVAAWVPQTDRNCAQRTWVKVLIDTKPYYGTEIEYTVHHSKREATKSVSRVVPFGNDVALGIVRHVVGRSPMPSLPRYRTGALQIWRPANNLKVVRTDVVAALAGVLLLFGLGGLISAYSGGGGGLFVGSLIVAAIGVILLRFLARRPYIVRSQGKPRREPRSLSRVDSWQTVIFGAGAEAADFRRRFGEALQTGPTERFSCTAETVWYWGVDGKEEREQLVLTAGRGVVFCQIYQYGNDLYVGWDGHVNYGQWAEKTIASGIDKKLGLPVAVSTVVPGTQSISEYDVIDLSCLMEWTHAQLANLAKRLLEELKIDQEIDFNILRGERQGLTGNREERAEKEPRKKTRSFRRTG